MSSAGHEMDSINRMKPNSSLRMKRSSFNILEANTFRPLKEKRVYEYKSITPEFRKRLAEQLTKERRIELIKNLVILTILAIITLQFFL